MTPLNNTKGIFLLFAMFTVIAASNPSKAEPASKYLASVTIHSIHSPSSIWVTTSKDERQKLSALYSRRDREDKFVKRFNNKVMFILTGVKIENKSKEDIYVRHSLEKRTKILKDLVGSNAYIYCNTPSKSRPISCQLIIDNNDVNEYLIRRGLARFNHDSSLEPSLFKRYAAAELKAKNDAAGVWDYSKDLDSWIKSLKQ